MVQVLEPKESIFGRVGGGIGKGLAEQIPKEVDRYRLSQGLQQLERDSGNLSPIQNLTRLASIPGALEHPQLIESFSKLAKEQATRRNLVNKGKGKEATDVPKQGQPRVRGSRLDDISFGNFQNKPNNRPIVNPPSNQDADTYAENAGSIQQQNEGRPEAVPVGPWSPERFDQEIANEASNNPYATYPELVDIVKQKEAREIAQPQNEQAKDKFNEENRQKITDRFNYYLEKKLQKKGEATFADLPGEYQVELIKGAEREFLKGEKPIDEITNKWAQIGLEQAKTLVQAKELASKPLLSKMTNQKENLRKLNEYGKIYNKAGNSEQYYNMLKNPANGFGFTPQTAAWIAYDRSPKVKKTIENFSSGKGNVSEKSRRAAINIEDVLTPSDSLLAIAREYTNQYPAFDQAAFFKQLSDDSDRLPLSPRQKRELAEGAYTDFHPNWNDRFLLPFGS